MSSPPQALITGVTGQDGFYLARLLLGKGYRIVAGVRNPATISKVIGDELPGVQLQHLDLFRPETISAIFQDFCPSEIYHLAGKSAVQVTWDEPVETVQANVQGTVELLEAMRKFCPESHLVFAGSGDCFDHDVAGRHGISPQTPFRCTSPYAISKAAGMQFVQAYRNQHGLKASVAVLMNHTSPRRPLRFVERKIVHESVCIAEGNQEYLTLGSLETCRDWSWAEDIVEGIAALGSRPQAGDFIFASGHVHTTRDWVRIAFHRLGLDPEKHIRIDPHQLNRGDRPHTFGNIAPTTAELGWTPQTVFTDMVQRLIDAELSSLVSGRR